MLYNLSDYPARLMLLFNITMTI